MRTATVLKIVLPLAFVAAGAGAFAMMRASVGDAEAKDVPLPAASVEVVPVEPGTHRARVTARGTVQASARVELIAQVSGKVVDVADGLTPGRRFRKGELVAQIDPRDYQNALTQAEANLRQAEVELQLEQGRVAQARREWELLGEEAGSPLALRGPQLAAAEARVASAQAAVGNAQLALERTRLVAPFDAVTLSESLEVGQVIAPGAAVASLMGTDRFRVRVSLPVQELALLDLPDAGDGGPRAVVRQRLGDGSMLTAEGFALRALGELDAETRTAGVIVAVDDPLGQAEGGVAVLPGAYVEATIDGREEAGIFAVPRVALVDGGAVWVAEADDTLGRREVGVAWGDAEQVYVRSGLQAGDRVVVTPMALPVVGLPLRVQVVAAAAGGEP